MNLILYAMLFALCILHLGRGSRERLNGIKSLSRKYLNQNSEFVKVRFFYSEGLF